MGFFSNLVSGVVKVALTPVATGGDPDNTKDLLASAGNDFEDALDDATGN